jgi:methionyl-tRNA formyltransferase
VKTILVLGKGELAIRACEIAVASGYFVAGVVPVEPEPEWTASLVEWARDYGVPTVALDDAPTVDVALSVYYDRILSPEWIARRGRALNLHNAPLPLYRGVNPINWALKNGEATHGVTLHEVVEEIDAGPIVAQVTFPIWPDVDEVRDVYRRCVAYGRRLLSDVLPILDRLPAVPQEGATTYYTRDEASLLEERAGWTR